MVVVVVVVVGGGGGVATVSTKNIRPLGARRRAISHMSETCEPSLVTSRNG